MKHIGGCAPAFLIAVLLLSCSPSKKDADVPAKVEKISYAVVKGYSFKQSPAAFSLVPQAPRHVQQDVTPVVSALNDSLYAAVPDSLSLAADEVPPTYEDIPFFVVTTDSAFKAMVRYGASSYQEPRPDSVMATVDFRKEFVVVLYAPPAAMTDAAATLSVNAVNPDAGVIYVSTSSLYSALRDSAQQRPHLWQVAMYRVEKRDFHRVGIVAEDTTYFGL